jgi:hypothetical protein
MVIKGNVKREKGEAESRKKKVKVNQLPSTISMAYGQLKGHGSCSLSRLFCFVI